MLSHLDCNKFTINLHIIKYKKEKRERERLESLNRWPQPGGAERKNL